MREYGVGVWSGGDPECRHTLTRNLASPVCATCGAMFDVGGQIGLERSPKQYIDNLVSVFTEVRRVLHPTGTLWIVIGDGYGAAGCFRHGFKPKDLIGYPYMLAFALRDAGWYWRSLITWAKTRCKPESVRDRPSVTSERVLVMSPGDDAGESDRVVLMCAKRAQYHYDREAIVEPYSESSVSRAGRAWDCDLENGYPGSGVGFDVGRAASGTGKNKPDVWRDDVLEAEWARLPVWDVSPESAHNSHHAVYPERLVAPMVLAATSEAGCCGSCGAPFVRVVEHGDDPTRIEFGDRRYEAVQPGNAGLKPSNTQNGYGYGRQRTMRGFEPTCECAAATDCSPDPVPCRVLDPFSGTGTTGAAALKLGRHYTGIEINERFCAVALERLARVEESLGRLGPKQVEEMGVSRVQLGMFGEE